MIHAAFVSLNIDAEAVVVGLMMLMMMMLVKKMVVILVQVVVCLFLAIVHFLTGVSYALIVIRSMPTSLIAVLFDPRFGRNSRYSNPSLLHCNTHAHTHTHTLFNRRLSYLNALSCLVEVVNDGFHCFVQLADIFILAL